MTSFQQQLIDDLQGFSPELLQPGLSAGTRASRTSRIPPSSACVLEGVERLVGLLPRLVDEASTEDLGAGWSIERRKTAARACLPRRPSDYGRRGVQMVPRCFEAVTQLREPDHGALCHLLFWIQRFRALLDPIESLTLKRVAEARLNRAGDSEYARSDEEFFAKQERQVLTARTRLDRGAAFCRTATTKKLQPCASPPSPFPRTAAWNAVRRLFTSFSSGLSLPRNELGRFVTHGLALAETSYLYQRWCGMRLIEAFIEHGLSAGGDVVGCLYLGGQVKLSGAGAEVDLWIEPRLTSALQHGSGFRCSRGPDLTPDYLLVTSGQSGPEAFVLDPTTSADPVILDSKFKYLSRIESSGTHMIAGVPVVYGPRRSWAAAPIRAPRCQLKSPDGRRGVVPLHPLDWSAEALLAWTADIVEYARAWSPRA